MDKIYVNGMKFYGYHGVFEEENRLGQRYEVDVILEVDATPAGETDDLTKTVDYGDVYARTKEIMEGEPVKLVETLNEKLAASLFKHFPPVQACVVKVIKPDPPIPGHYNYVAVETRRERRG